MSGFLKKYLFYEYFKIFFAVFLLFFPILFFADFFLTHQFNWILSFLKIPFRYGQMIGMLSFIASYISVKKILYTHSRWIFISLKYKKEFLILPFLYLSFILSVFLYFFIIPFNEKVFSAKSYSSPWAILLNDHDIKFIYYPKNSNFYDVWEMKDDQTLTNYTVSPSALLLVEDDFYIIWNETKKMSFRQLEEYRLYLLKNDFSLDDYHKQKHVYYSRGLVIFTMLLSGFLIALDGSIWFLFISFLLFNWVDLLAFFLPLKYCILLLWGNIFFWLFIVLVRIWF